MNDNHIVVEINVDSKSEAGYRLTRANLDKVYKYMYLLQLEETNEVDMSSVTETIQLLYDMSGLE